MKAEWYCFRCFLNICFNKKPKENDQTKGGKIKQVAGEYNVLIYVCVSEENNIHNQKFNDFSLLMFSVFLFGYFY